MNCKNCNTHLPENAQFCPKCGANTAPADITQAQAGEPIQQGIRQQIQQPVPSEYTGVSAAGAERAVPKGFSSKRNIIIVIAAAILLIVGSVIVTAAVKTEPAVTKPPVVEGTVTFLGEEYDIGSTTLLDLSNKGITDEILRDIMPEIERLTNLTFLGLSNNQITDISTLEKLTNLKLLELGGNQIADITPLAKLTNLKMLSLNENQITNIAPLEKLTNLKYLHLQDNKITDISTLAKLTNLTQLHLEDNKIIDLTPLEKLTGLTTLVLYYNQIADITTLEKLTNLTWLELGGNLISEQDIKSLKSKHPNCRIDILIDD